MPEICRFLGIIVTLNWLEHGVPHFHVKYNEFKASISIDPLKILEGNLPPRVVGLVMEWATLHLDELKENWNLAMQKEQIKKIEPLV
jgi:hypothetical protein